MLSGSALAEANDFSLAKLGNPQTDSQANSRFRVFARQLAAAMTSVNLAPPETLGHSGFAIAPALSVIDVGSATLPTQGTFSGPLLIPSLHLRKGLPFSFEVGARVGWLSNSRMGLATIELKWAINEGWKPLFFPDIGVRGHITKLINAREFDLTSGGLDIGMGKQFALGGMVTLTPYLGWNMTFVGATTGTVDFRPNRTLADSDAAEQQFSDFFVFRALNAGENLNHRLYAGFRFIAGVLQLGAEFAWVPETIFSDALGQGAIPRLLVGNFMLGLDF
jgi:hypothetical protein